MLKIVFLSTVFASRSGGAEVATELLFKQLKNAGHTVYIISTRKPTSNFDGLITLDRISTREPELPKLKKLTNTLELQSCVTFPGWVSQEEIMQFYENSDVVLIPSIYPESFGRGSIETMSFGKPVVASNVWGIREAVVDGVNGFLVPPGMLMRWLRRFCGLLGIVVCGSVWGRQGEKY